MRPSEAGSRYTSKEVASIGQICRATNGRSVFSSSFFECPSIRAKALSRDRKSQLGRGIKRRPLPRPGPLLAWEPEDSGHCRPHNVAWSALIFWAALSGLAFVEIVLLWLAILATSMRRRMGRKVAQAFGHLGSFALRLSLGERSDARIRVGRNGRQRVQARKHERIDSRFRSGDNPPYG
jgi:hypothetical protein